MKTVRVELYKTVILAFLTIGIPAFIAGWVVAVNFSGVFETGYKMAFLDIRSGIKESIKDGQQFFYMNGIKFSANKFTEDTDSSNIKVVKEDEDIEKVKHERVIPNQLQHKKLVIARNER
jgi:hypothetical protein